MFHGRTDLPSGRTAAALFAPFVSISPGSRAQDEDSRQAWKELNSRVVAAYQAGNYVGATSLAQEALELARRSFGDEDPATLASMNILAELYRSQRRYAEAEPLVVKCLEATQRVLGEEHPDTLRSMNNLAGLYESQGRYGEAEPLYVKCLETRRRVLGEEHPNTLQSTNNLAALHQSQGRYGEAEPLYVKCMQARRRVLGEEHPDTLSSTNNLALLYKSQGRYGEAESLYVKCLEAKRRILGEEHPDTLLTARNLGVLLLASGKREEGARTFLENSRATEGWVRRSLTGLSRDASESLFGAEELATFVLVDTALAPGAKTETATWALERILWRKGLFGRMAARRERLSRLAASTDAEIAVLATELQDLRSQYSSLALAGPGEGVPWQSYRDELARVARRIDEIEKDLALRTKGMGVIEPPFEGAVDSVAASLGEDGALVEVVAYRPAEHGRKVEWKPWRYAAFVLRRGAGGPVVRVTDLGAADEIDRRVTNFRKAITLERSPLSSAIDRAARELHETIWAPLAPHLSGVRRVYFAPDGQLSLLPLAAL
ncbi:MAG: tetratricopeptide repeat protein, partial [Planctomycetes bacterium]|nr:tetratricopeptide repeat protein [Planctomycetota bacterium]